MDFVYEITISVSHESGKFAGRDEIGDACLAALEEVDIDLDGLGADGESVYVLDDINVREVPR